MDRFRLLPSYHYYNDSTGAIETRYKKPLRDYKISGNSIQEGTPSPDNPIEIESVGDYDAETGKYKIPIEVSGKNLFDNIWELGFINTKTGENQGTYTYIRSVNYTKVSQEIACFLHSPTTNDDAVFYIYYYVDEH